MFWTVNVGLPKLLNPDPLTLVLMIDFIEGQKISSYKYLIDFFLLLSIFSQVEFITLKRINILLSGTKVGKIL